MDAYPGLSKYGYVSGSRLIRNTNQNTDPGFYCRSDPDPKFFSRRNDPDPEFSQMLNPDWVFLQGRIRIRVKSVRILSLGQNALKRITIDTMLSIIDTRSMHAFLFLLRNMKYKIPPKDMLHPNKFRVKHTSKTKVISPRPTSSLLKVQ